MATIATLSVMFTSNAKSLIGDLGGIGKAMGVAGQVASALVNDVIAVGQAAVDTALRINETEQAFRTMTSSGRQSEQMIRDIRDIAKDSDFGFEDLEKAGVRLLQLHVPADQVVQDIRAIDNAINAVEGTAAQMNAVVNAIGRISATGEVTKRTLVALFQAGVDGSAILRKEFGITGDVIEGLREKHISGAEATQALIKGMAEATATGVSNSADAANRAIKNFNDSITKLEDNIGKRLLPALGRMADEASSLLDTAAKIVGLLMDMGEAGEFKGSRGAGGGVSFAEPPVVTGGAGGATEAAEAVEEFTTSIVKSTKKQGDWIGELDAWTATLHDGKKGGDAFVEELNDVSTGMQRLTELALEPMMNQVFKVEQRFSSLDEGIAKLSQSIRIESDSVDKLFPKLEHAGELFQKMNQQILEVTVGEGGGMLAALHSIQAQNEGALRLLGVMEALGFGAQSTRSEFDKLAQKMPNMSTAFDDLLASFQHLNPAVNAVADNLQTVADVTLQSVAGGMAGAAAGATAINTGLAQLSAGLGAYGQMAASGTLPGGLPGGVPDFTGGGTPGGVDLSGPGGPPTSGAGITNPFTGTPWGGGQHGFPPGTGGNWGGGTIVLTIDGQQFGRISHRIGNQWNGSNSIGVRGS